ncbi:MAG: hydroxymethylglutaryl-CoA lyase [Chloroflexota bacterium]|jgi:hydroxymethylglutaryl-CoA lyase
MQLPKRVNIMEVGPRDGFQAEHQLIPTEDKIAIVNALAKTGISDIQVTSFVHPKAVPNLADAEEVMARMDRPTGVRYHVLVPNMKGLQRALPTKPDGIHLMMSVTESHNRANGNRSIEDAMREFQQMVPLALEAGIRVEAGMACVFGCPFEGEVPLSQLDRLIARHIETGVRYFSLGDTIGVGNPKQVYDICAYLLDKFPEAHWSLHFHNTRDMALANTLAAMQAGMTHFDGSVGGLGGCPYAPGATGNVATEDLVNMLHEMGVETGIDLDALIAVAKKVAALVPHPLESCMVKAGKRTDLKPAPKEQQKIG